MRLEELHLKNFRTYSDWKASFNSRITFIIGRNASGKTNIIEAISFLSLGKSFRGASDADVIRYDATDYYVGARYCRGSETFRLEMGCDWSGESPKRKIKLNGKRITGRSALIGNLICVFFSPDDISIVEGGPSRRRKFLDVVLSHQSQDYLKNLILYNRTLKQRNSLLKRIRERKGKEVDLDPWNASLARYAGRITERRRQFTVEFQEIFSDSLEQISRGTDQLRLRLHPSSSGEEEDFIGTLEKYRRRDLIMGYTTIGPHRHSISFEREGRDIIRFGSQGQKRSVVLALRIAQFYYLKKNLNLSPILLIDDVIRELDADRRMAFVGLLRECGQAVFTTPDLAGMEDFLTTHGAEIEIFRISDPGRVETKIASDPQNAVT